ncbi:ABC transporter substrate-binding protein [Alkalicoccobacillus porphyridii]|nr:ABC transporter substrate-binding protein [Alkalicoccobacillus porphyridii]
MSPFREVNGLEEKYLLLRSTFYSKEKHLKVEFTHEEVEKVWFCSKRNVKRVLKQLEADGYFHYIPGKGRGNSSKLVYSRLFKEEIEEYCKRNIELENLDRIAFILRLPIPRSWIIHVSEEVQQLLGFKRSENARDILYTFKSREVSTLDPLHVSIALEVHLTQHLGDTLVRYDAKTKQIIPHLAHHFSVDDSGKLYTFYLRKDVHFHNMDKLSSADIAHTVKRLQTRSKAYSWLAENIEKVVCETPYKVSFHLNKKNTLFLHLLSSPAFCVLPVGIAFNEFEWVGTGAFMLKERTKTKIILQAFEHYFKERPFIDEIHFHAVSKDAANLLYLQADPKSEQIHPTAHTLQDLGMVFLLFNQQDNQSLRDQNLRNALYHLIDVPKIIRELDLEVMEASSFSDLRSTHLEKNQQLVSTLLQLAHYNGEELRVGFLYNERTSEEAKWLCREAQRFGINLILTPISHKDFYNPEITNQIDILLMNMVFSYDRQLAFISAFKNEHLFMMKMLHGEAKAFVNNQLQLYQEAPSSIEREKIIIEIETFLREQKHLIFLYHPIITRTIDPLIQDATHYSLGHVDYTKLWLP